MLFNSIEFLIFLPIVFSIYWIIGKRNIRYQNLFILVASYFFYGWWDYRFLSLIFLSSVIDYKLSLLIHNNRGSNNRIYLYLSLLLNLGILGYFKYSNFFIENFSYAFTFFGHNISPERLNIILPVGISFYTFQTLSYTIDVYRNKLEPTKDFFAFATFVSFFPQLVAGPIERATNLLPQFLQNRSFNYENSVSGLRQILLGFFKKIVIADNAAHYVNLIFDTYEYQTGSTLLLGAVFFSFQIYGDFSGYSDIAIGVAKLFGFDLMKNFNFPYFSRDIAEFWRRWHISLSTWFRDYVYIPLGGSKSSTSRSILNIFIIFIVSGLWHGANWTFIVWGALNAVYFLPLFLFDRNRKNVDNISEERIFASIKEIVLITINFFLVTLTWIFFRSNTLTDSLSYLLGIFNKSLFELPSIGSKWFISILIIFYMFEWLNRKRGHSLDITYISNVFLRYTIYFAFIYLIIVFGRFNQYEFIYFAF